ncbi:MAG: CvpA family protein [Spirochaetales bacterium]|nr:CvpA family protein [Spirochaetales bacterium]
MILSILDIIFIIILLITSIRCTFRGFVTEVLSFAAVIMGVIVAVLLTPMVTVWIEKFAGQVMWSNIAAFLIIFLVVYLVVKIFEGALYRLLERINLDNLDRALGFFLGLLEGIILIVLIVFILSIQPFFDPSIVMEDSKFSALILKILPSAAETIGRRLQEADV